MDITLKPGEKAKVGELEIELKYIIKKRLPVNPETGEGGDEEIHLTLVLRKGRENDERVLERHYPRISETEFGGYKITLLEVESFQEWAKFRVDVA